MAAPEVSLQWLRPLVESKTWDYCVVWKLGDDPSRFIEWAGCCCSGAHGILCNVKKEKGSVQDLPHLCRDVHIQHHVRTMACEALAAFPNSIPLYSGSRGEVVMMNESKWLIHGDASASKTSYELNGTQVLIPVVGGLIELYNSRLIPKDQKTIEFVRNRFKICVEEAMNGKGSLNISKQQQDLDATPKECPTPLHLPATMHLSQTSEPCSNPSVQGSSTGSTPANTEHVQCDSASNLVSQSGPFKHSIDLFEKKLHCNQNLTTGENNIFSVSFIDDDIARNGIMTSNQGKRGGQYRAKNLVTERKRRNKIKDGLFALRALVPKITKMDRASIVGDAIDYIKELQESLKELENELHLIDAEDVSHGRAKPVTPDLNGGHKASEQTSEKSHSSCSISNKVHVEVNQIGASVFMLRFIGKHCRGEFSRMMEIMDSLGLLVLEANVTTFNGEALSVFRVEARGDGAYDSQKLEYVLVQLTN